MLNMINVFTKYAWVKSLKIERCKTVLNAFIDIVNESNCNHINYGLIQEENFTTKLCKNG